MSHCVVAEGCIRHLYLFGFTSVNPDAGSSRPFMIEASAYSQRRQVVLSPGNYEQGEGSLWKIPFDNFKFLRCVWKWDLKPLAILVSVNDDRLVDSISPLLAQMERNLNWSLRTLKLGVRSTRNSILLNSDEERVSVSSLLLVAEQHHCSSSTLLHMFVSFACGNSIQRFLFGYD